jgi:PIN domain nuclease of toxin-antitoxin system
MLNLDTHVLVALMDGSLRPAEARLVEDEELAISDIVLWELATLVQLGRLELNMDGRAFRRLAGLLTIFPITPEIASLSTQLDFQSDPADELIAATSLAHAVPLLTRDRRILRSKIVPLVREQRG